MYAAQFRGRQLLATEPYQHARITATKTEASPTTTKMQGRLLELHACHSSTSPEKVQVVAQFDGIWQWQHESEPRRAANAAATLAEKNRVVAAMQWCDVAHAVCTAGVVVDLYIYMGGKCCTVTLVRCNDFSHHFFLVHNNDPNWNLILPFCWALPTRQFPRLYFKVA